MGLHVIDHLTPNKLPALVLKMSIEEFRRPCILQQARDACKDRKQPTAALALNIYFFQTEVL